MGLSVENLLSRGMGKVEGMSAKTEAKLKEATESGKEMKQEDLILINYEMGRFQVYSTMLNNVMQSILQQMKDLAKSIH